METVSQTFRTSLVRALKSIKTDLLQLDNMEPGEGDVIVKAVVSSLPNWLQHPVGLMLRSHHSSLLAEMRMIAQVGSGGSLMNCTPDEYLSALHPGEGHSFERLVEKIGYLRLLAHTYVLSPRTMEDLLGNLIDASNGMFVFTTAVRDRSDGEVWVKATMKCDLKTVPDDLAMVVSALFEHAVWIVRTVKLLRSDIVPDAVLRADSHHPDPLSMLQMIRCLREQRKADKESSSTPGGIML